MRSILVRAFLFVALVGGGSVSAGWFGPTEKDVSIQLDGNARACKQSLAYGCCWALCFRITNNANVPLTDTRFTVTGTISGRSTKYYYCGGDRSPCESDAIVPPHESRVVCSEGGFYREWEFEAICDPLTIIASVDYAKFK